MPRTSRRTMGARPGRLFVIGAAMTTFTAGSPGSTSANTDAPSAPAVEASRSAAETSTASVPSSEGPGFESTGFESPRSVGDPAADALPADAVVEPADAEERTDPLNGDFAGFSYEVGAEVSGIFRARRQEAEWTRGVRLTRARVSVTARYGRWVRATIEPDFSAEITEGAPDRMTQDSDVADAFAELEPIEGLRFRFGQFEVPFGWFETERRWDLPSVTRGVVSELLFNRDQLDLGGRKIGAKIAFRWDDLVGSKRFRPRLDVGAFKANRTARESFDLMGRISFRPWLNGSEAWLGVVLAQAARTGERVAPAFVLGGRYHPRRRLDLGFEVLTGRALSLLPIGFIPRTDATFVGIRALSALKFPISDVLDVEPFAAVELFEADLLLEDDEGLGLRGGFNFRAWDRVRLSAELDHQFSRRAFPERERTTLTLSVGVSLE